MNTKLAHRCHPHCCICGSGAEEGGLGLGVDYVVQLDGSVKAMVFCRPEWEGYPGWVHGGIEAALIDGAMTHCLFAMDVVGVTADLRIRYQRPLKWGYQAEVTAHLTHRTPRLYRLKSRVVQRGYQCAVATSVFMNQPTTAGV